MSNDHYARVRDAFLHIRELDGPSRAEALVELKHTDASIHDQVLALLAADTPSENANSLEQAIEEGLIRGAIGLARAESLAPGDRIGPYTIEALLGEGGFGAVYRAQQHEPVKRVVAIKVLKAGMDTKQVVARFEQERQALALMDHANIARVFDAGATPSGRPYVAMEYWPGEPIDQFCADHNLDLRARLDLMLQVCAAVQHAHMKGVIHRDLKPGNVLVALQDGRPQAKVIDFGIAKAIDAPLTDLTLHTEHRQFMGTPHYMSPEQAEGNADIDTRTDVYSLGVLLYQLLTGQTPFTSRQVQSAGLEELRRLIREVDPPRPSTRLGQSTQESRTARSKRLETRIRGELDWITMKALEKDRRRRYASPSALSEDLERYLTGDAVVAAPPSRLYRVRKFTRRNRGVVTSTGLVVLALLVGFGTALWQAKIAATQRDTAIVSQQAEANERARADERAVAAETAEKAEKERADQLKQVLDFQSQMLAQIDTTKAGIDLMADVRERFVTALVKAGVPEADRTTRVDALRQELVRVNATDAAAAMIDRTILRPAIKTIDERFKNDPKTDASLRQALAALYQSIGLFDAAFPLQESALVTRRRVLGQEHPDTLASISQMGSLLRDQGKFAEAEPYSREALEKSRRLLGEEHPNTLASINNMGLLLRDQGKFSEAETYYREALEKHRRVLGEEHPNTLTTISNMGFLLRPQGKFAEAEPYYREALEKRRRVLGEEHPHTLSSINNMGALLHYQGKFAEAEPYYREALEKRRRVLGEEHPDTLTSINNMGALLDEQGKLDQAEPYYREALEKRRRVLGEEHPNTITSINNMGVFFRLQGKLDQAEPYYREALEKSRRVLGEEHPATPLSMNNLGGLLRAQGKLSDAEPLFREALEIRLRVLGEEHPQTLLSINNMGALLLSQSKHLEAIDLLAPAELAYRRTFPGGNTPQLAGYLANLGRARVGLGYDTERFTLAEANLIEAHTIYLAANDRGPAHNDTSVCVQALVDLYTTWHAAEPDAGYDARAAAWNAKLQEAKAAAGG